MAKLEIQFAGMCLFARKEGIQRLDVLLPFTEDHLARLFVPAAYHAAGVRKEEFLNGAVINLSAHKSPVYDGSPLHEDIVDLTSLTGGRVESDLLFGEPSGDPLLARVTLGGGRLESLAPGIRWEFGSGARRRMATSCVWILDGVSTPLQLPLPHDPGFEVQAHEGRIRIHIFNAPGDEKPDTSDVAPTPDPGTTVNHFGHFYTLLTEVGTTPVPHNPEQKGVTLNPPPLPGGERGTKFTCIAAQAAVE